MRYLLAVLITTLTWGCSQPAKDHVRQHEILAFGTIINVTIRHHNDQLVTQAFERLETDFLTMHRVWHPWETVYEAVRSDLPCIPCPGYTCKVFGKPKCILDTPVARVAEACERILSRT